MRESKEKIKSRMIRNAARIWGFQEPQPESSFDPLVSLLLGSCAFELEKISREINSAESRIIERLVNILTPQPITSPHPAHAVAYAEPTKKSAKVLPEFQFYTNIKISDQTEIRVEDKEIYFSPAGTYKLTDGRVRYLAAHKRIYEFVESQYKDILTEMFTASLPPSSVFVGLELNEKLTDMTLFFDVINEHLKQAFLHELEVCRCKIGDIYINANRGIKDIGYQDNDLSQIIKREIDLSSKISYQVNRYYSRQFVTIGLKDPGDSMTIENKQIPEILAKLIEEKELASIEKNIIWIEFQFTSPVSEELLENLYCSLNCFPVINRRRNEFTGSTRELINIIPLHTEDTFFDLYRVVNSKGEEYKISYFDLPSDLSKGSALLRLDGVGRFDARDALEFLEYLMELMKEESAAFNVIGSDMISSNIRELNQAIARLEKKIEDVQLEKGDTAYLMLKPMDNDRQVYAEFWSTNCSMANNIRSGSHLDVYEANDLDYNATRLVTSTTGGREKPSTEDRINTYRRALLSGERIITQEDIKALCFEKFGESISHVRIAKGIEKGKNRQEGFLRTIDIHIKIKEGLELSLAEMNSMEQKLLVLLETRSSNILPFRIFWEK